MPDWLHYLLSPWTTPFTLVAAVVAAAAALGVRGRRLAVLAAATASGLAMWAAWKSGPPSGLLDLKIYVGAARAWLHGGSMYDYHDEVFNLTATYPPIGPIAFSVFDPFPVELREVVFTFLSMVALGASSWFAIGLAGITGRRRVDWSLWGFAAAVVTTPVWLTIRQGQINILLWFLVLLDIDALRRSRAWSGLGIGLATAIKLVPGVFLVWLATTRRWAAALRAAVVVVAATALGWALAPSDSRRYWTDLLWDSGHVGRLADDRNNSVMGVLARLLPDGTARSVVWLILVATVAVIGLVRATRAARVGDLLAATAIVGCVASAISPISWAHHLGWLVLALLPFVLLARTTRARVLCALGYLVLVGPMGHGDEAWLSSVRAVLLVAAVLLVPITVGRSSTDPFGTDPLVAEPGLDAALPSDGQGPTRA